MNSHNNYGFVDATLLRALLKFAVGEGVAPLLAARLLASESVASDARDELRQLERRSAADELARNAFELRVIDCLLEAELNPLVLKGAALARWLYPRPHLRPRCDIDLLFSSQNEVMRAGEALRKIGFAWNGELSNGPAFERVFIGQVAAREFHVDAHWHLTSHPAFFRTWSFEELCEEAMALPALHGVLALSPHHAMLHNALHRVADLMHGTGNRLVGLYDVHLLAKRMTDADWVRLGDVAKAKGVAGPMLHALAASSAVFGGDFADAIHDRLGQAAKSESFRMAWADRRWYFEWHALVAQPLTKRPGHVLCKLFPSPDYMMQRYALSKWNELPAGYLHRGIDGLRSLWRRTTP